MRQLFASSPSFYELVTGPKSRPPTLAGHKAMEKGPPEGTGLFEECPGPDRVESDPHLPFRSSIGGRHMVQRSRARTKPEPEKSTVARTEGALVTPGFHPLADFASFGPSEAEMLLEGGTDLEVFTKAIADSVSEYLLPRLPRLVSGATVDRDVVEEWLTRSSTGP